MNKFIILLIMVSSCGQWTPQKEQEDLIDYRYDVPIEEKEDAN